MMSTLRVFGGAVYISICSGKFDFNTHNHGQSIRMHLAGLGLQLKARLCATLSATREIIILWPLLSRWKWNTSRGQVTSGLIRVTAPVMKRELRVDPDSMHPNGVTGWREGRDPTILSMPYALRMISDSRSN